MLDRFILGEEDTLFAAHIGRLIDIDLLVQQNNFSDGSRTWRSEVHCGRIVGFSEDRGTATADAGDKPGDLIFDQEYNVTIKFEDGRSITIRDRDQATITLIPDIAE